MTSIDFACIPRTHVLFNDIQIAINSGKCWFYLGFKEYFFSKACKQIILLIVIL